MLTAAAKTCTEATTWPDAILFSVLLICGTVIAVMFIKHVL
jgi:hypothetical protein